MKAHELKEENKMLHEQVSRMEERIKQLRGHIELQRAEIIALQNREEKSGELKEIFEKPDSRLVKSFTIDNRNEDSK